MFTHVCIYIYICIHTHPTIAGYIPRVGVSVSPEETAADTPTLHAQTGT